MLALGAPELMVILVSALAVFWHGQTPFLVKRLTGQGPRIQEGVARRFSKTERVGKKIVFS